MVTKPHDISQIAQALRVTHPAEIPTKPANRSAPPVDHHQMRNTLSAMLAGVRALGADLRADCRNPQAVRDHIDEYEPRLVGLIADLTSLVNSIKK